MIEIKFLHKMPFKGYTLVEGFPGAGLVAPISIGYMINKLDFKYVGFIDSDKFPPVVSIHQGVPLPAVRLYCSEKYKLLTIFAEINPTSENDIYEMSKFIYNFVKENELEQVISISEIPTKEPTNKVYGIASNPAVAKRFEAIGVEGIGDGVAAGLSAMLLMQATIDGLSDANILVPIVPGNIDPKYAEIALQTLSKLTGIEIDMTELEKEAKAVEAKTRSLIKKKKEASSSFDESQSMYV